MELATKTVRDIIINSKGIYELIIEEIVEFNEFMVYERRDEKITMAIYNRENLERIKKMLEVILGTN